MVVEVEIGGGGEGGGCAPAPPFMSFKTENKRNFK